MHEGEEGPGSEGAGKGGKDGGRGAGKRGKWCKVGCKVRILISQISNVISEIFI